MTLIAAQVINGIPIILGDLLLTRERGGNSPNVNCIPTIKRANEHLSSHGEMRIVGLSQKINIVSKNVCIAWSGAKYQASSVGRVRPQAVTRLFPLSGYGLRPNPTYGVSERWSNQYANSLCTRCSMRSSSGRIWATALPIWVGAAACLLRSDSSWHRSAKPRAPTILAGALL